MEKIRKIEKYGWLLPKNPGGGESHVGFMYEIKGDNQDTITRKITGTYVPKELILDIASWVSIEFYDKCNRLVVNYFIQEAKKEIDNLKVQLEAKDKALEDRDRHVLLLKDLLVDDTKRVKTQIVYISTSKSYAMQNRSKPGGVDRVELLRSRLSTYNSRSAKGDEWYFFAYFFVADYRQVESRLKDVLGRFRDKKNKEMYVLKLRHMTHVVEYLCEHYNDEVDEVNSKLHEYISGLDSYSLRSDDEPPEAKPFPITPSSTTPPPIPTISTQTQEAILTTREEDGTQTTTTIQATSQDTFKAKLEEYIRQLDSSTTTSISRKKVFDDLKITKDRTSKLPLLKQLFGQLKPNIKLVLVQTKK